MAYLRKGVGNMMEKEWKTQIQYENALRNLNENAWRKMQSSEKLEAIQHVENEQAMRSGREPCKVSVENLEKGVYGEYRRDTNEIVMSKDELDKDMNESINTILHEGTHATQKHLLDTLNLESATEEEIANIVSLNMPLREDATFQEYWNSPAEEQARDVASQLEEQINVEQQTISCVDQYIREEGIQPQNQILQTFDDYSALNLENVNISNDIQNDYEMDTEYSAEEDEI